jgi:hypothetical protein
MSQINIIDQQTNKIIGNYKVQYILDLIKSWYGTQQKKQLKEVKDRIKKELLQFGDEVLQIRKFQDAQLEPLKQEILESIGKTQNLIDLLHKIEEFNQNYSKKIYTNYREDEIYMNQYYQKIFQAFLNYSSSFDEETCMIELN